jgi:site-specific recombinase XerD
MTATDGFVSAIADRITQFLEHKRVLGRRYQTETDALRLFDRYLVEHSVSGFDSITPELIDAFVISRPRTRPRSFNHLVGVLRRLFDWLVSRDVIARSPVRTSARRGGSARIPFIFSPEQARRLLQLAASLPDVPGTELRGPTFHAVFGILYGLGLRVSEVCRLDVDDLDRRRRLLVIRDTKFDKDRLVPFGPRVGAMLDHYLVLRRARGHDLAADQPLLSAYAGRRMRRHRVGGVFRLLRPRLDLELPTGASPPRVHDLRHSFAVRTLLRWYRTGVNPTERLLHLSTFLGHVQPESTSVYLAITADLLSEAGGRFEAFARPLVIEVRR